MSSRILTCSSAPGRAAHQQLPALEPGLHGALFLRHAVARLRSRRVRSGTGILRRSAAPLRYDGRARGRALMLRQRVLTAVVLGLALLAVILWLPAEASLAVFAVVAHTAGAWEWSVFPRFPVVATRWICVLCVALAMAVVWVYSQSERHLHTLLLVALVWWILAFFWVSLAPATQSRAGVAGKRALCAGACVGGYLSPLSAARHWPCDARTATRAVPAAAGLGSRYGSLLLPAGASAESSWRPRSAPARPGRACWVGFLAAVAVAAIGAWWFNLRRVAFLSLCVAVVLDLDCR